MRGLRAIPLSLEGATRPGGRDCAESPRAARERAVIPRGEAGGRAGLRRADAPAGRVLPPSEGRGSALTCPARRRPAGAPPTRSFQTQGAGWERELRGEPGRGTRP